MFKFHNLIKIFVAFFLFAPITNAIGDRLIVSINGVPYTQRQAEVYLNVKEALKAAPLKTSSVITQANWPEALTVFIEDMVVLQEAARLGSFAAPDELTSKYLISLKTRLASGGPFTDRAKILGLEDSGLGPILDHVLRVAAFRRSKERSDAAGQNRGATVKWLDDLMTRQTIRRFDDAMQYTDIHPVLVTGGEHG